MSAIKSIIMKDQSDKEWLQEDYDDHWEDDPFQAIGTALTICIGIIVAILAGLAAFLLFGPMGLWT